jgi:hypothetical protein
MRWVPLDTVASFALHPGLAASWPELVAKTLATLS